MPARGRNTSNETPIISGTSTRTSFCATTSGVIAADRPRISSTLKMLLPTTLPSAT
jgi:hypothetical protein